MGGGAGRDWEDRRKGGETDQAGKKLIKQKMIQ